MVVVVVLELRASLGMYVSCGDKNTDHFSRSVDLSESVLAETSSRNASACFWPLALEISGSAIFTDEHYNVGGLKSMFFCLFFAKFSVDIGNSFRCHS